MSKIFHPLLALIASAADRQMLLALAKALGQAIEELITIVTPLPFYRWVRDEIEAEPRRPKGGSRSPNSGAHQ